ncbi:MAG: LysR family transcriptional regulator [Pseudomonadota bacterium]
MNLNALDLNLLKVFDAVMREGNVTRAADRLGLTQPAVSNAVGRLRGQLKDDLFLRGPGGMHPTPRAEELAGPIRHILSMLEDTLDDAAFDPETSRRTFRLVAVDLGTSVLLARLAAYLGKHAPGVNIRLYQSRGQSQDMLDKREADFALLPLHGLPARFGRMELEPVDFVVMMRPDHPLADGELTLERFAECAHIIISLNGDDRGFVDDILDQKGLTRRVAMTITNYATAPAIVAASDLIVTAPRRLADIHAPLHGLVVRKPPFRQPARVFQSALVWHQTYGATPAHDWFRRVIWDLGGS